MLVKLWFWILAIAVAVWVLSDPARAGSDAHLWAVHLGTFFSRLAAGK